MHSCSSFLIGSLIVGLACGCGDGGQNPAGDGGQNPAEDGGQNTVDGGAGLDPDADIRPDTDGDGISDERELELGTDPNLADSDGDGLSDGDEIQRGTDPLVRDSDGDGLLDGDEILLGTNPTISDEACSGASGEATLAMKPVDVILAIDTSSSMSEEIDAVEANLNNNLAVQLENSGVDYQIILLADHGEPDVNGKFGICINSPLSGHDCATIDGTALPVDGATLKHYPIYVGSKDAFDRILSDFRLDDTGIYNVPPQGGNIPALDNGYGAFLREDAVKVFLVVSDDDSSGATTKTSAEFDDALLALSPQQFGTAEERNYVFHSIIGLKGKNEDTSIPWLPSDPISSDRCGEGDVSVEAGVEYQANSILTGGLRFPLCDNANFDAVFQAMAVNVTEGATLECAYQLENPVGGVMDFSRMVGYFTKGSGEQQRLVQVPSVSTCVDNGYYIDASGLASLCPVTCNAVKADPVGRLAFHVGCSVVVD